MTQEVLDFGFRELETLEDFSLETKGIYDDSEYAKNDEGLYKANKSLRLRNNQLASIDGLSTKLSTIMVDHTALQWLDLSFNQISRISNSLNELVQLKVLYLHGNRISQLKEIQDLSRLPLTKLTLHGNPIETQAAYRKYTLQLLPALIKFDFAAVTNAERRGISHNPLKRMK
ncbi:unnamed protein product [Oikopleura dioica]|uniref:Leucine-rich repeat-containing protein 51 n=1 Tax=Oikopleura dioica TaxID=34765 RepID=E4X6S4_OIKDI|nr:unnamed protein product [Oikopleura dioica]